ncbi:L-arabinokinase [Acorus gramineus]|uniref:L-arabinokinase n=1 Tax=Acorus gramineus TaxID=55184 RepID=A0AAV8ZZQ4_ACOGR|nr:L-arabinokinase [Acorus gramineus]
MRRVVSGPPSRRRHTTESLALREPRASILAAEVEWLNSIKADLVVSDVVPVACRAAADAGIRSVCVTNFSWDFIYAEYVMAAGYHHRSIVWQDQGFDVIAEGLDTLKNMAHDMNEEMDRQVPLMDEIDAKVDRATADLKNTNVRLSPS